MTDRKSNIEEVPQESDSHYHALFESIDEGMCVLEMIFDDDDNPVDYRFLEVNSTFEEQTGLYEPLGKTARELVPDLDESWFEIYGKIALTGKSLRFENHAPALNRWFDVYAFRIGPAENRQIALLFSAINERKRRELNTEFLSEINAEFAMLSSPQKIMNVVGEKLTAYLGVDRVVFAEVEEGDDSAKIIYDRRQGDLPTALGKHRLTDFMSTDFLTELRAGRPVAIDDVMTDRRTRDNIEAYQAFDVGSQIHVPYLSDERWKFVLAVYRKEPYSWQVDEIDLVREVTARLWLRLERAYAEEALRTSEQRLQFALDAAQMGTWSWDPQRDIGTRDARTVEILGVDQDSDFSHAASLEHNLKGEDALRHAHAVSKALDPEGDGHFEVEFRWYRPDGEMVWVLQIGQAHFEGTGADRRATLLTGTIVDITERKCAEAALAEVRGESERQKRLYEALMTSTPDLMYIFDGDYQLTYANDALLEMWERSWEDCKGKRLIELGYEPWHAEMHEREIDEVSATKKPIRGQVPFAGAHGERIYDYIFVPVLNAQGEVEGVAGTTRDITEHKETEEALREADRRKDRFMAVLSHELRNPLAPIKLNLHLLDHIEPGSKEALHARGVIERQVDQLVRLVDDLLDVTRVTRDKIELQEERLEINELLRNTVEDHRSLFEEKDIELELTSPAERLFIQGDPNRLAQVIGNLLQNALKFTDSQGRTKISLGRDKTSKRAIIRVKDTGVGMNEATLSSLFEPFVQADESLAHSMGGLGLGLALVKGLVQLHDGKVSAHSAGIGEGTEFVVELPLEDFQEKPSSKEEMMAQGNSRRILIIEDNLDVANSLSKILELKGHEVQVAHNGKDGLALARTFTPAVVLCDIGLPGMDGYSVGKAMRAEPQLEATYLIALSGYAMPSDVEKSQEAGFDQHLAKPPNLQKLEEFLAQAPAMPVME